MKPTLICLCGRVASGKSTATEELRQQYEAVIFNADQWMVELFGEDLTREMHEDKLKKCKMIMYGLAKEFLDRGVSVILDFGFWKRQERDEIRQQFNGYEVKMIYLCISEEEQIERVLKRNQSDQKTYTIPLDILMELNAFFEEPEETEEEFEVFKPF